MNAISLVFALLLTLSFGAAVCLEKQTHMKKLQSAYVGHLRANRSLLNQIETHIYKSISSKPRPKQEPIALELKQNPLKHPPSSPKFNPKCARLSLRLLMDPDPKTEKFLQSLLDNLLKTFYSDLLTLYQSTPSQFSEKFIATIRTGLLQDAHLSLEKLHFMSSSDQALYYRMTKGLTGCYPSLLDWVKLQGNPKICLAHAHPQLLSLLFGEKAAEKIYAVTHQSPRMKLSLELIQKLCQEVHAPIWDPALVEVVEWEHKKHPQDSQPEFVGEDSHKKIVFKKKIHLM